MRPVTDAAVLIPGLILVPSQNGYARALSDAVLMAAGFALVAALAVGLLARTGVERQVKTG